MSEPHRIGLGPWSFYFLAKLALFWKGLIGFHALENLAFAALLLCPPPSSAWGRLRPWASVPAAVALLYYDSWLPSLSRALSQGALLAGFSGAYLLELLGRFVNWQVVALLVILWVGHGVLARWLRTGVLALAAMAFLAVQQPAAGGHPAAPAGPAGEKRAGSAADLDAVLKAFYAAEARRRVAFPPPAPGDAPFDVIFLHVCSLSWDDLKAMELDSHPLWQRFDFLFTRFNSGASYSGPAAIRIQRGTCGQAPHGALYSPAPEGCYLMAGLQAAGYEPSLALNHDGHFDGFLGLVKGQAGMNVAPLPLAGLPVPQRGFDDSPIYDDLATLSRWLEGRGKSDQPRVAAFFNTISLHDGNRLAGAGAGRGSLDTYRIRLKKLLDDTDAFLEKLERSGRRAVVALIPEHGAAVRGDRMQIAGLREIPSPAITLVPVGVKVVGPDVRRSGDAARVDASTSYLAVSHLIARMLEYSPYGQAGFAPATYLADLPTTPFVAENESTVVMEHEGKYFLRQDKEGWTEYGAQP